MLTPCNSEIYILSEHFSPSTGATAQLVHDISTGLASRGLNITVITSTPSGSSYLEPKGLRVIRFASRHSSSINIFSKLTAGLLFTLRSLIWLLSHVNCTHRILIVSNPPFIALLGPLLAFLTGARYFFLLQDLFPRSAELTGIIPSKGPISSFWRTLIRFSCMHSSRVILLSSSMMSRAINEYSLPALKIKVIHNWSVVKPHHLDKVCNPLINHWDLSGKFIVQYSGNFGRLHDLLTLLEAARLLSNSPIHFLFIGGGSKLNQIQSYRDSYMLANISVYPYQSRDTLHLSLAASDISAVTLIPGSEDAVAPSKYYGIIASSKPVLLISSLTSNFAREIIDNNIGLVIEPGDSSTLASKLIQLSSDSTQLSLLSSNAFHHYDTCYGREKSLDEYYNLLTSE